MARGFKFLLVAAWFLVGCSTQGLRPPPLPPGMAGFEQPSLDYPYFSRCKMLLKSPRLNQAGNCEILLTPLGQLRLVFFSPLGGRVYSLWVDGDKIRSWSGQERLELENNPQNRKELLPWLEVEPWLLAEVLWGRKIHSSPSHPRFEEGRPVEWRQALEEGELLLQVTSWQEWQGIWLPKVVQMQGPPAWGRAKLVLTQPFAPGIGGY